jgi:hypothetical protein
MDTRIEEKHPAHKVIIGALSTLEDAAQKTPSGSTDPTMAPFGQDTLDRRINQLLVETQAVTLVSCLLQMIIPETEKRWVGEELRRMAHLRRFIEKRTQFLEHFNALLNELDPPNPATLS